MFGCADKFFRVIGINESRLDVWAEKVLIGSYNFLGRLMFRWVYINVPCVPILYYECYSVTSAAIVATISNDKMICR